MKSRVRDTYDRGFLVTGASGGLGRAFVYELAPRVRSLVLHGRDTEALAALAEEALALGCPRVDTIALDLAAPGAGRELATRAREFLGVGPGLVANAGASGHGPADERGADAISKELRVNAGALGELLHELGGCMRDDGDGAVLIVASLAGLTGIPEQAAYAAAKAWSLSIGGSLAVEFRKHGIRVSTFAPGLIETPFFEKGGIPRDRRWSRRGSFASPEDSARVALRGLERGRMYVYQGLSNRAFLLMQRILPRRLGSALIAWSCRR